MALKIFKNFLLITLFSLFLNKTVFTQTKNNEQLKDVLITFFEYCANNDYSNAAKYLVYRGDDTTRKGIDVYDYSLENDKNDVKFMCDKVKYLLENGGEFEFKEYKTKKDAQGEWFIWLVNFSTGTNQKVYFLCFKINGKYALVDIG